jgi:hypothetical protein
MRPGKSLSCLEKNSVKSQHQTQKVQQVPVQQQEHHYVAPHNTQVIDQSPITNFCRRPSLHPNPHNTINKLPKVPYNRGFIVGATHPTKPYLLCVGFQSSLLKNHGFHFLFV